MTDNLPTMSDAINPEKQGSPPLSEINSENKQQESESLKEPSKENNPPLSEPNKKVEENEVKKDGEAPVKTEMCQLIYYDFSLK